MNFELGCEGIGAGFFCFKNQNKMNNSVKKLTGVRLVGNVTPNNWYKKIVTVSKKRKIKNEEGVEVPMKKPHLLAIAILSDLVYWHTPSEVRDKDTGETLRYETKFSGLYFNRSYNNWGEKYGVSGKVAKEAIQVLERMTLINTWTIDSMEIRGKKYFNVLHFDINTEKIIEISTDKDAKVLETVKYVSKIDLTTSIPFGIHPSIPNGIHPSIPNGIHKYEEYITEDYRQKPCRDSKNFLSENLGSKASDADEKFSKESNRIVSLKAKEGLATLFTDSYRKQTIQFLRDNKIKSGVNLTLLIIRISKYAYSPKSIKGWYSELRRKVNSDNRSEFDIDEGFKTYPKTYEFISDALDKKYSRVQDLDKVLDQIADS